VTNGLRHDSIQSGITLSAAESTELGQMGEQVVTLTLLTLVRSAATVPCW
jgi:hypothetical protein